MNIGVVYNLTDEIMRANGHDQLADMDVVATAQAARSALEANGRKAHAVNVCAEGFAGLQAFDAVFSLAETIEGSPLTARRISDRMDQMGVVYSGSSGAVLNLCENKAWTKAVLLAHGLPTPRYQVFRAAANLHPAFDYPLIVKPLHEDGSIGITDDAVVHDDAGLACKVGEILRRYRQPALVEEYIDGRELHVAVTGAGDTLRVLPITETVFTAPRGVPRIVSYEAKWVPDSPASRNLQLYCLAGLDPELEAAVKSLALRVCYTLGCRDYMRVDFRLRGHSPYVLEVNPNPCLSSDGSNYVAATRYAGLSYEAAINGILEAALSRLPSYIAPKSLYL